MLQQAALTVFPEMYKLVLQKKQRKEVLDDVRSRDLSVENMALVLVMMSSCIGVTQVHSNGPIEVMYDKKQELYFPSVSGLF